ncbi:MAG: hypothetical protein LBE13_05160, partial [Bacteroidales bacterium]|nr:hypothetical protein [Bacteroidales bacterium]
MTQKFYFVLLFFFLINYNCFVKTKAIENNTTPRHDKKVSTVIPIHTAEVFSSPIVFYYSGGYQSDSYIWVHLSKNREALPYLQKIVDKKNIENDTLSKSYLFNFREKSHFALCTIYCQLQMYDKALEHINIAIQDALLSK